MITVADAERRVGHLSCRRPEPRPCKLDLRRYLRPDPVIILLPKTGRSL